MRPPHRPGACKFNINQRTNDDPFPTVIPFIIKKSKFFFFSLFFILFLLVGKMTKGKMRYGEGECVREGNSYTQQ